MLLLRLLTRTRDPELDRERRRDLKSLTLRPKVTIKEYAG